MIDPTQTDPLAVTTTPDGTYRYTLYDWDVVTVEKRRGDGSWDRAYIVTIGACDCIGYDKRADCKHADIARGFMAWWAHHPR